MPDDEIEIKGPLFPEARPSSPDLPDISEVGAAPLLREIEQPEPGWTPVPLPHQQETARRRIAYALIVIFGVEVLYVLVAGWLGVAVADIKELMLIVFGPTGALLGSAIGFYFGTKSKDEE